jgi:hypothetical protein
MIVTATFDTSKPDDHERLLRILDLFPAGQKPAPQPAPLVTPIPSPELIAEFQVQMDKYVAAGFRARIATAIENVRHLLPAPLVIDSALVDRAIAIWMDNRWRTDGQEEVRNHAVATWLCGLTVP